MKRLFIILLSVVAIQVNAQLWDVSYCEDINGNPDPELGYNLISHDIYGDKVIRDKDRKILEQTCIFTFCRTVTVSNSFSALMIEMSEAEEVTFGSPEVAPVFLIRPNRDDIALFPKMERVDDKLVVYGIQQA